MDRLIRAVDKCRQIVSHSVTAQIGVGEYEPANMEYIRWLDQSDFDQFVLEADVMISHAGIGNIVAAKSAGIPILVMARSARYGEHINDHQADTLASLGDRPFIFPLGSPADIPRGLDWASTFRPATPGQEPSDTLAARLKNHIQAISR